MRTRKVVAAVLALGLGLGASLIVALPAAAAPIIGFTDPGTILTTDTDLNLGGTTTTEISSITITLPDADPDICVIGASGDEGTWDCSYATPEGSTAGEGQLYFEFADESTPEVVTFTIHAPAPDVSLNEHSPFYETTTSITLSGETNYELSGVEITFAGGDPVPCEVVDAGPSAWSCSYSNPDGLPVGEASLDFSFVDAEPLLDDESFTVNPALTFDEPGTIYSDDSSVQFTGTTLVPISTATISFADGSSTDCDVVEEGSDWSCTGYPEEHLPAEPTFPGGPAHLDVTLDGFTAVHRLDFTVIDYSAVPYLEEPVFPGLADILEGPEASAADLPQVRANAGLTGGANDGDVTLYSWNDDDSETGGPERYSAPDVLWGECELETEPEQCALGVGPGSWEIRATQNWVESGPEPTTKSYNFRIPDAPEAHANPQPDGSVEFWGYGDAEDDLITVTDPAGNEICTATTVNYGEGGEQWSCESEEPLDPTSGHFFVGAQDGGSGLSYSIDFSNYFGLDSTYIAGGRSALTEISIPNVSYHFTPGGLTVTATPTDPATIAGVQVYPWDYDGYGGGCPNRDEYSDYEGDSDFPGIDPGELVCSIELNPGFWTVSSYQDTGDGETEAVSRLDRDFFIPEAPVIGTVSGTGTNAVTISGDLGEEPSDSEDADYRAYPGDLVHVYNGTSTLCSATVTDDLTWSCTTGTLPGGSYSIRAAVEDRSIGCECSDPTYLRGGLSALSTPSFSITLPDLPAPPSGGSGAPTGPTTPAAPIAPSWSFDVKGLDLSHVHPGDKFTITGSGLPAGSVITIELHSAPITLGTVTVAPNGTFSLSGTIPTGVDAGEHHIVATLTGPGLAPTTVDKAITVESPTSAFSSSEGTASAEGSTETSSHSSEGEHSAATAPNILTDSLNPIAEVFTDPGRVPAAFAAGLVLLLFAIMPAHLLNATVGEQYQRFARRVPRLRQKPRWYTGLLAVLDRAPVLGGVVITAISAFLFAFADPTFGFNLHSLRLVLALAAALFAVTYLANAITAAIMRQAWKVDVVVSIRPLGLVLAVVGVIASRILDFSPGFLIGLVLGLSIATESAAKHAWKAVLIRTSIIVSFGVAAWIIYSSIAPGVHHEPTFWNELVLELFVAIATEGVVMMLIEMLPFHLLEGERLYRHSRLLWAVAYLALLVVFLLAVVPWEGNWRELGESFWPWFTAVAIFGVICVGIYLYFRFLAPHEEEGGDHDASLEDAQERISVGDD